MEIMIRQLGITANTKKSLLGHFAYAVFCVVLTVGLAFAGAGKAEAQEVYGGQVLGDAETKAVDFGVEVSIRTSVGEVGITSEVKDFRSEDDPTFNLDTGSSGGLTGIGQFFNRTIDNITGKDSPQVKIETFYVREEYTEDSEDENAEGIGSVDTGEVIDEVNISYDTTPENYTLNNDNLRPGKYVLRATDLESGRSYEQDFTWGVLAINPNKVVYEIGDTAELAIAVLDDKGDMVCDADVYLNVVTPSGETMQLSTLKGGGIKVNEECKEHKITRVPDYETRLSLSEEGVYQMSLNAKTLNGEHTITDYFTVEDGSVENGGNGYPEFDVERITGTRIYPLVEYPVVFKITPKNDFSGVVEDEVPWNFIAKDITEERIFKDFDLEVDLNSGLVEGPQFSNYVGDFEVNSGNNWTTGEPLQEGELSKDNIKVRWQVDWKAGNEYFIAYKFDSPDESPQFYLLGDLEFYENKDLDGNSIQLQDTPKYDENRPWQLAIDQIPSGIIIAWPGAAATIPTGYIRVTSLDTYFLEGTTSDPSGTPGGASTHTHTSPTHTHSIEHDHGGSGSTDANDGTPVTTKDTGLGAAVEGHTHTTTINTNTGESNNAASAVLGAYSNDPPYTKVIWIQSNGTHEIPEDAWIFYEGDSLTGFTRQANNTFLLGADASGDGGATDTTDQSDAHWHTDTGHTHTENSHTHSGSINGTASGTEYNSDTKTSTISPYTHSHTVSGGSTTATEASDSSGTTGNADAQPPFMKLNVMQNDTGGGTQPIGTIAVWTGTTATVPNGWEVCNGAGNCPDLNDKFIKAANANGESGIDTGGNTSHSHDSTGGTAHSHTINSHTHTFTVGNDGGTAVGAKLTGGSAAQTGHSHTYSETSGGTTGTAPITASPSVTETRPNYKEAVFIRLNSIISEKNLSGTAYQSDKQTEIDGSGTSKTVTLLVNGAATGCSGGPCTDDITTSDGAWAIDGVSLSSDDVVTVYLDDATEEGTTVYVSNGAAKSDIDIYQNHLIVRDDAGSGITPDELYSGDGGDDDIKYVVSAASDGNLTVDSGFNMHVWTGDTFDSILTGGTVTTQGGADMYLDDNASLNLWATTNTIAGDLIVNAGANAELNNDTNILGGSIRTLGSSPRVGSLGGTVTLSGTGVLGGGTSPSIGFNNLTISGTTTIISDISTFDLTVDGTMQSSANVTTEVHGDINGTGTITMTGGTVEQRVNATRTFGTTSGSNNWTFNNLTFSRSGGTAIIDTNTGGTGGITVNGILKVSKTGDGAGTQLQAGNRTWTLSNTNEQNPLTLSEASGVLTPENSTFVFSGDYDSGNVNIPQVSFWNIQFTGSETYDLTGDLTSSYHTINDLTIGSNATLDTNNYDMEVEGSWTRNGSFIVGTSTVTLDADTAVNITGDMTGSNSFYNLIFDNASGEWTVNGAITTNNDFLINTATSVSMEGGDLTVKGDFDGGAAFGAPANVYFAGGAGTTQHISDDTQFYNLNVTTAPTKAIELASGSTQYIGAASELNLDGQSCDDLLIIRSSTPGTAYTINRSVGGVGSTAPFTYIDIQDATFTNALSALNSVNSGNNTSLTIGASACIGGAMNDTATLNSFQRKVFYDTTNSRNWLLYHDGAQIKARYSTDEGATWNYGSSDLNFDTNDFSLWSQTISGTDYVWIAATDSNDIVVNRGVLGASSITWDTTPIKAFDGTGVNNAYSYPVIIVDNTSPDPSVWVGARHYDGTTPSYTFNVIPSDLAADVGDGTWPTQTFTADASTLNSDQSDSQVYGNIVPLTSNQLYATFVVGNDLLGCKYDGTGWVDSDGSSCTTSAAVSADTEGSSTRTTAPNVNIDNIGNPGPTSRSGRQVVQTSGGTLYVAIVDSTALEIWSSEDGFSWTYHDNDTSANAGFTAMAIDSEDQLHLLFSNGTTAYYRKFDTTSDTPAWDTAIGRESIETFTEEYADGDIAIDANDVPHVVMVAANSVADRDVFYSNRVGGSWDASPVSVDTSSSSYFGSAIIVDVENIPEISYLDVSNNYLSAVRGNQNDATSFTDSTDVDTDVEGSVLTKTSIGIDDLGNTWVAYTDDTGSDGATTPEQITLIEHSYGDAWSTWGSTIPTGVVGISPSVSIIGQTIFVFYHEYNGVEDDIRYYAYDSGIQKAISHADVQTGTYQDVKARYQGLFAVAEPWFMDYLYSDGTDVYWDYVDLRPVNIDDASDFGSDFSYVGGQPDTKQIVRTNSGDYYTFFNDGGSCEMWKSSDGYVWELQDSIGCSSGALDTPVAIALNNTDDIHTIFSDTGVKYSLYDTNTDSLGTTEPLPVFAVELARASIEDDGSGVPHLVVASVYYNNRVGGSWNGTYVELPHGSSSYSNLTFNQSGLPLVLDYGVGGSTLVASIGDDSDPDTAGQWTTYTVDSTVETTLGDAGSSIAVDVMTGDTWVAYVDSSPSNFISLAKFSGGDITDPNNWLSVTSKTDIGKVPSIAIAGNGDVYVFYTDDSTDSKIVYDVYDPSASSWAGETVLHTPPGGTDYSNVRVKNTFEWDNFAPNRIDYLFSDGTDVYWDYLYLRREPTNIDDASDFDNPSFESRPVVRTSDGYLYSFVNDSGNCEIWKSYDGGNTWSIQDSANSRTCTSASSVSMAVDSTDTLHLLYKSSDTTVGYCTFSTTTDTFGSSGNIHTAVTSVTDVHIAVDSNDIPHAAYISVNSLDQYIYYNNKVGGSWNGSDVEIDTVNSDIYSNISLVISDENAPEVSYLASELYAAQGSDNDPDTAVQWTTTTVDSTVTVANGGSSLGVDSSGNTWIAFVDSDGYITLVKNADGASWSVWTQDINNSNTGYDPSIFIDDSSIFILYEDDQDNIAYDVYDGADWSGEVTLEEHGSLQDVKAKWSYIDNYDSTGVAPVQNNTYYFDASDNTVPGTPTDTDSWTNDTNAFNGDVLNASSTTTAGTVTTNNLIGEGTNAPTQGGTISSVRARVYGSVITAGICRAAIKTDNGSELLGTLTTPAAGWGDYVTLSTPTGGWTWSKMNDLESWLYYEDGGGTCNVNRVEILVESTNNASPNEIDYVYSDGTDVWYNRLILSSGAGTQDYIDTVPSSSISISSVSDTLNYDVHILYSDTGPTAQLSYKRWDRGNSSWDTSPVQIASGGSHGWPTLSTDSSDGDLTAFWIDTSDSSIDYTTCDISEAASSCSVSADWTVSGSVTTTGTNSNLVATYGESGDWMVIWNEGESGGYVTIDWSNVPGSPVRYTQNDFEIFAPQASVTLTDTWPPVDGDDISENTALTQLPASNEAPDIGEKMRIQMNMFIEQTTMVNNTQAFQLEYAEGTDCTVASGWTALGGPTDTDKDWRLYDESGLSASAAQVNQISTSTSGSEGNYSETNATSNNINSAGIGRYTEWDWPIQNYDANPNSTYCFRMAKSGGAALDEYNADSYPKVDTAPGTGNLMRHGKFFKNSALQQGFIWAD